MSKNPIPVEYRHLHICVHEIECLKHAALKAIESATDTAIAPDVLTDEAQSVIADLISTGMQVIAKLTMRHHQFDDKEMDLLQLGLHIMIDLGQDMMSDPLFMATQPKERADNIRNIHELATSIQDKFNEATGHVFTLPKLGELDISWMVRNPPPAQAN